MHTIYRSGEWNALVVPGALVALPPDAPHELIAALWERLAAERTLAAVVDTIAESVGGSFLSLPPFVAAALEGANVRVAVRGDITAEVTGTAGVESLSGANVTTWSERFVPDATRISLRLSDASGSPEYPVVGGVIRVAELVADIEAGDAQDHAQARSVAAPDASPEAATPAAASGTAHMPPAPPVVVPLAAVPDERDLEQEQEIDAEPEPVEETAAASASEPDAAGEPAQEQVQEQEQEQETEAEPQSEPGQDEVVSDLTLIPAEHSDDDFDEFEQLFGDTVHSVPAAPPAPAAAFDEDHDGATISVAEARALRADLPPVPQLEPEAPTALLPTVGTGRIRVSTGQVVTLDRTVVIGRRPRAPRASGASLPHLVAVESPQQDISRSHLEIRPEGDTVVVIDLHTTNGSTLLRPGNDPVRLHPGEQTLVLSGDVIDLGDGVTVAFEDLP